MKNKEYHLMGRGDDPRDIHLSASQLICGFNPRNPMAHPQKTLARITGEPTPPTKDMLAGTLLHSMLLEGHAPIAGESVSYTARLGKRDTKKLVTLDGIMRVGEYLIPPADVEGNHTLVGQEQRRFLEEMAGRLDLELAAPVDAKSGAASLTLGRAAFEEAEEIRCWIDSAPLPQSALHARHLLMEIEGEIEKTDTNELNGIYLRARPDKVIESAIIELKRTWKAHPSLFWREAERSGWWLQLAFYAWVLEEESLDWRIVAIAPGRETDPQAYVYTCPDNRMIAAQDDLHRMLDEYSACVESGEWWRLEETLANQPSPANIYSYQADYDQIRDEMAVEELDDADEQEASYEPF